MEQVLAIALDMLPGGVLAGPDQIAQIPADPGAYALMLELAEPVHFKRGKLAATLQPGSYIYAGSANGPGGMRSRLARHMRRNKALRWHIDALTIRASTMRALAIAGGSECAIVAALMVSGRFTIPLPGFGSSDCRRCASHLLAF